MATPEPAVPVRPAPPPTGNNPLAVAAMVCGILGLVLCWVPFVGLVLAILGIVFGGIGISKAGKVRRGRGMAITGLVLGISTFVLGLLAAIAIPAFLEYTHKSKQTESSIQLRMLERRIRSFYNEHARLPTSATIMPGPVEQLCTEPGMKLRLQAQSEWIAAGWSELDFHVDVPSRYAYRWTQESPTRGYAEALTDLDCDAIISTTRVDFEVIEGNLRVIHHEPTLD